MPHGRGLYSYTSESYTTLLMSRIGQGGHVKSKEKHSSRTVSVNSQCIWTSATNLYVSVMYHDDRRTCPCSFRPTHAPITPGARNCMTRRTPQARRCPKTTESEKLGQKHNTVSKMFSNSGEYTGQVSTNNSHGKASIPMIPPIHDAA